MDALSQIKALISDFAGYAGDEQRRLADEQIRAYVGERLAALPGAHLDALGPDQRARYDRVLLLCEFMNQAAFGRFEENATPARVDGTLAADVGLLSAAAQLEGEAPGGLDNVLEQLEQGFERRAAAMTAE